MIPIGLLIAVLAALSTWRTSPDFIGTFGPWWLLILRRRAERRDRDEDF